MSAVTLAAPLPCIAKPVRRKFTIIPRLDEDPKIVGVQDTPESETFTLFGLGLLLTTLGRYDKGANFRDYEG